MKKSKGNLTVEQMARRVFCPNRSLSFRVIAPNFPTRLYVEVRCKADALYLAKAARRFVRMENEQKGVIIITTKWKAACRKTRRAENGK